MMKNKWLLLGGVFLFLLFIALILSPLERKKTPKIKRPVKVKITSTNISVGKIAIVIDDWGYSLANPEILKGLNIPLTCAVLPGLKNSAVVAKKLQRLGLEVILHLPMQPKETMRLENNTISITDTQPVIAEIITRALDSVYFAKGVSNHMGSAVTEDLRTSKIVLEQIKKHKLYFLDSFVTPKSVCAGIAKSLNLRFARRDIFLDNLNDAEYIHRQLIKLKNIAKIQGQAIGIGHDRKNTLQILKTLLPQLKAEGYEFVFVSELAR